MSKFIRLALTAAPLLLIGCVDMTRLPGVKERIKQEDARSTKETDEAIKRSPIFQELNRLCTEDIPQPDGFRLIIKNRSSHPEPSLGYGYYSEADYQKVKGFYLDYFTRNGWKVTDQKDSGWGPKHIKVSKGNYMVIIYHGGMGKEVNYKLHCKKLASPEDSKQ